MAISFLPILPTHLSSHGVLKNSSNREYIGDFAEEAVQITMPGDLR